MKKTVLGAVALMSLILCVAAPFLYFQGKIVEETFKSVFLLASCVWFLFAILWQSREKG